ncbi:MULTISPECIES: hypothetical protein [unclassified Pseudomonas]|uniref:hypothetical protein n=1 Tax=unclassified Pseudomonas TaxID=196821 RepID=UPI001867676A|nr:MULTISPECIES: hypothetical protein [unclassified Pseudomonas]
MSEVKSAESVYVSDFSKKGCLSSESQEVLNERGLAQVFFLQSLSVNKEHGMNYFRRQCYVPMAGRLFAFVTGWVLGGGV